MVKYKANTMNRGAYYVLNWPKCLFSFFYKMVWKNLNKFLTNRKFGVYYVNDLMLGVGDKRANKTDFML